MRYGKLSDTQIVNDCPEYQPIPMKVVSEVLKVPKGENDYAGIKQIYRKVPPRPMNINALATSLSQMGKNRAIPLAVAYPSVVGAIKADIKPLANFKRETGDLQTLSAYENYLLRGGFGAGLEETAIGGGLEETAIGEGVFGLTQVEGMEEPFEVLTTAPVEPVEPLQTPFVGRVEEIVSGARGGARVGAGRYSRGEIIEGIRFDTPPKEIRQQEREREERIIKMGLRGELLEPVRTRFFGRKGGLFSSEETPTGVLSGFPSSVATREGTPEPEF